jgi:hypothetical protein
MTIALRKQLELKSSLPQTSFGPFHLVYALPWLILAAALRVVAHKGGGVTLPAIIAADIAVLHAFFATAQRSIEVAGGRTDLGGLTIEEQFKLSLAILWRIALLMVAATLATALGGYPKFAPHLLSGLDGMAFDQFTDIGKFWSATIATLVLLIIVNAERRGGKVAFFAAAGEFVRRGLWLGTAVIVLGLIYLALGWGQEFVRSAVWQFWQASPASPFIKRLIFFVFVFSFAMLRLWITLAVLTFGLKQSYVHDE